MCVRVMNENKNYSGENNEMNNILPNVKDGNNETSTNIKEETASNIEYINVSTNSNYNNKEEQIKEH